MENLPNFDQTSLQKATAFANSSAGQKFLSDLQENHSKELQQAFTLASTGDYTQLKAVLQELVSSPDAKNMLEQFGR